jgi:Ala-tRNA(Pro) deacylase
MTMSIPQRIRDYLESKNVSYEWLPHPEAFTAQEVAHSLHVSGKRLAKTVVLDADGRLVMTVLPASHRMKLDELKTALGAKRLEMLPESELAKVFPDCDLGAIPPLGSLYGMDVWVDRAVADSEEIVFTAGSHVDAVRIAYSDFVKLTKPRVSRFSEVWASRAA